MRRQLFNQLFALFQGKGQGAYCAYVISSEVRTKRRIQVILAKVSVLAFWILVGLVVLFLMAKPTLELWIDRHYSAQSGATPEVSLISSQALEECGPTPLKTSTSMGDTAATK